MSAEREPSGSESGRLREKVLERALANLREGLEKTERPEVLATMLSSIIDSVAKDPGALDKLVAFVDELESAGEKPDSPRSKIIKLAKDVLKEED